MAVDNQNRSQLASLSVNEPLGFRRSTESNYALEHAEGAAFVSYLNKTCAAAAIEPPQPSDAVLLPFTRLNVEGGRTTPPMAEKSGNPPASASVSTKSHGGRSLKPGSTAKNNKRHFVRHDYHDHSRDSAVSDEACFQGSCLYPTTAAAATAKPEASNTKDPSLPATKRPCRSRGKRSTDDADNNINSGDDTARRKQRGDGIRRGPRGGVATPFPEKLQGMLKRIEDDGHADIVGWQPHGRCFVVHEPKKFVDHIMPRYFRQTKLTSFQRQLNLYGFTRLTAGVDKGGYYHELFLRGRPSLARNMVRTRIKGTGIKAASSPDTEPDFYAMPVVWDLSDEELRMIPHAVPDQVYNMQETMNNGDPTKCASARRVNKRKGHKTVVEPPSTSDLKAPLTSARGGDGDGGTFKHLAQKQARRVSASPKLNNAADAPAVVSSSARLPSSSITVQPIPLNVQAPSSIDSASTRKQAPVVSNGDDEADKPATAATTTVIPPSPMPEPSDHCLKWKDHSPRPLPPAPPLTLLSLSSPPVPPPPPSRTLRTTIPPSPPATPAPAPAISTKTLYKRCLPALDDAPQLMPQSSGRHLRQPSPSKQLKQELEVHLTRTAMGKTTMTTSALIQPDDEIMFEGKCFHYLDSRLLSAPYRRAPLQTSAHLPLGPNVPSASACADNECRDASAAAVSSFLSTRATPATITSSTEDSSGGGAPFSSGNEEVKRKPELPLSSDSEDFFNVVTGGLPVFFDDDNDEVHLALNDDADFGYLLEEMIKE